MPSIAVVTGSNKGIGYALVRKFARELTPAGSWTVYLTSRNATLGQEALDKLQQEGLPNPIEYHCLDIDSATSRETIVKYMRTTHSEGVNIWVNNAAIAFKNDSTEPFAKQAEVTNATNYFCTVKMIQEILPCMAKDSNLVNVSSMAGLYTLKKLTPGLYSKFMAIKSLAELDQCVNDFIQSTKDGNFKENGWPETAYGFSKMALTKAVMIIGDSLKEDSKNVIVNSCCPGYVDTDLSSHKGPLTIEQGAVTPYSCAVTRDLNCQGRFFNKGQPAEWSMDSQEEIYK